MIELSRTQDEEVGDGTTSVIILSTCDELIAPMPKTQDERNNETNGKKEEGGRKEQETLRCRLSPFADVAMLLLTWRLLGSAGEMLAVAEPLLEKNFHPTVICRGAFHPPFPVLLPNICDLCKQTLTAVFFFFQATRELWKTPSK